MNTRFTLAIVAALLACTAGWSQEKLGDVAGSIKLNPDAIVEKTGYAEDPNADDRADYELFNGFLERSTGAADELGALIEEIRQTALVRNDPLLGRLDATALELENQLKEFELYRLSDTFAGPEAEARKAAESCARAIEVVRAELKTGSSLFPQSRSVVPHCRQDLDRAEAGLTSAGGNPAAGTQGSGAAAEAPAGPKTDSEIVAEACEKALAESYEAFEECESGQYEALAALRSRTAENEMIEVRVFDYIRGDCLRVYSKDFVRQNECEVRRMTEKRLETE